MLTVEQIKNISFKKASIGGYRTDEVDTFIDDVVATVEDLKKKNAEILAKSELLMSKVEELRSNEDSVSTVLLKSQKEADKTVKEAKKQASQIIKDARSEADRIIADANTRIIKEKKLLVQITEEAEEIRERLIENFEQQIQSLKVLPESGSADKLEEELDAKYPTEVYSDSAKEDEESESAEEEGFTTIEEAVEDATAATEDSANAEAAAAPLETDGSDDDDDDEEDDDDEDEAEEAEAKKPEKSDDKITIDKSKFESRFGKLKFGEDYDVKKG